GSPAIQAYASGTGQRDLRHAASLDEFPVVPGEADSQRGFVEHQDAPAIFRDGRDPDRVDVPVVAVPVAAKAMNEQLEALDLTKHCVPREMNPDRLRRIIAQSDVAAIQLFLPVTVRRCDLDKGIVVAAAKIVAAGPDLEFKIVHDRSGLRLRCASHKTCGKQYSRNRQRPADCLSETDCHRVVLGFEHCRARSLARGAFHL
ncbi:MAG TPA: hypothetical protein VK862_12590, partial [Afifellaceae bacterium]|nr:hypothetical protein [Afifellaceae bacterium]